MNTKIKLITLAIIIGIIVLLFPNFVNARTVTLSDSTKVYTYAPPGSASSTWNYYTVGNLIDGTLATTAATHVFKNEFLFCYEAGQDLMGTNYYLVMEKYKLEANKIVRTKRSRANTSFSSATSKTGSEYINFAKGLLYIMSFYKDSSYSHDRLGDSRSYYNYGPTCDEINLALWGYLDYFNNSGTSGLKNFFGIKDQGVTIDNTAKKISKKIAYYNSDHTAYKYVTGSSRKAYDLYKKALDIYNGDLDYIVTGEFYKFREIYDPGSQQDLMFLKTVTIDDPPQIPEIKLNFYKVDYNNTSTGLSGAKLKVEKASSSNIDTISKTSIQSSGTDGKFETITIKPTTSNPGTVKIKITETQAPSGYDKLSGSITLTITYNKTTGAVTGITESSDYIDASTSSGVGIINFKNKPLIKLRFYKRNYGAVSQAVNGAKIKIERADNVENINGATSAVTLTSSGDYGFFDQITLEPTDRTKQMKIKITETTVPTNYVGVPSSVILTVTYNSNTGKVTSITADSNTEYFLFDTPTSGNHEGKGIIYIKNKYRRITDLTISKTDIGGTNKLQGTKFTLYLNNIKSVKIGTQTFTLSSLTKGQEYAASNGVKLKRPTGDDNNRVNIYGLTTNSNGEIKIPEIIATNADIILVTITEETPTEGYATLPTQLRLVLRYDGAWKLSERRGEGGLSNELDTKYWTLTGNDVKVQLKNEEITGISINDDASTRDIRENITKYEKTVESVVIPAVGVEFTATFSQSGSDTQVQYGKSDSNGHVQFYYNNSYTGDLAVYYPSNKSEVTVVVHEVPSDNYVHQQDKTYKFEYKDSTKTWERKDKPSNSHKTGIISYEKLDDWVNTVKITSITLEKKDPSNPSANMNGAEFKISLTNIAKINGSNYREDTYTVTNGVIKLENLEVIDASKNVEITVKEVTPPPSTTDYYYKAIQEEVKIILTRSNGQYSVTVPTQEIAGYRIVPSGSVQNNRVSFIVNNVAYISLSGQVWIDGQIGDKNPQPPDGYNNDGIYLNGIDVHLYSIKDGRRIATTQTENNGTYIFEDIVKTAEGYKIEFEYNGILYDEVRNKISNPNSDSDAREIATARTTLNNNFKTIDVNGSNNGTRIAYNTDEANKSKFIADVKGTEPAGSKIAAYTGEYKKTTRNIDCGLLKRNFDLAIGTDVKSAKLTINEKTTTYSYAQIMNGALDDIALNEKVENKSSETAGITYNLYLYQSDYNYRIADYQTDIKGLPTGVTGESELEAYVTYSVILKNQTKHTALVDKFVYYYNSQVYTPTFAKGDLVDGYEVENIEGNKITFASADSEGNKLEDKSDNTKDFRKEINIEFKVNKTGRNIILKDDVRNVAEITKYSTIEGGLIDRDSQPGNADVTIENENPTIDEDEYEDDTDEAKGINIRVQEGRKREISGTVFEDIKDATGKVDGINNDGTAVNDVIVQLIEIKNIGGTYYEYIWQETRSGNSTVKTTARNGYSGAPYDNRITSGSGQYKFTDFIPGNYIIRFIYGDGRTYTVTPSVEKYNGQAYQSTVDTKYKNTWYNTSGYGSDESTATDNEARRLETMIYTVEIDGFVGAAIKSISTGFDQLTPEDKNLISQYYDKLLIDDRTGLQKACEIFDSSKQVEYITEDNEKYGVIKQYALQKTWMSAETLKINIPVDASDMNTQENTTTATSANIVNLNNMNFGLRLRPQTRLTVEKHITALKIVPTGVGVQSIVDAKADIGQILDAAKNDAPVDVSRYKNRSCNNSIKENKQRILESRNRYRRTCTRS